MKKRIAAVALSFCCLIGLLSLYACEGNVEGKTDVISPATVQDTTVTAKKKNSAPAEKGGATKHNNVQSAVTVTTSSGTPTVRAELTPLADTTFTGFSPLPLITFPVTDAENARGLSTEKQEHSFGAAAGGVPHEISLANQKAFDSSGYRAITLDTKSKEKNLYLTFDCGYENGQTERILNTLKAKQVPAAFFCTVDQMQETPALIARMIKEGHIVGNHSANHPLFSGISRTKMAKEILTCDNFLRINFGYTAPFFRFPEGAYNESALDMVDSLGYTAVFWSLAYTDWNVDSPNGKDFAFQTVTARLHPGAILLLHSISKDNADALGDIIDYARGQGYIFRSLTQFPTEQSNG